MSIKFKLKGKKPPQRAEESKVFVSEISDFGLNDHASLNTNIEDNMPLKPPTTPPPNYDPNQLNSGNTNSATTYNDLRPQQPPQWLNKPKTLESVYAQLPPAPSLSDYEDVPISKFLNNLAAKNPDYKNR